jgi:hypothetical protein
MDDTGILPRGDMRLFPEPAREQISALPDVELASHSPMALRVCSVIWNCTGRPVFNCTGRPVFFWITVARSRTMPPPTTSSIVNRTRSQLLSLLSMARLNIARSRRRPSSCRRTRMVQTSFGFSGRFWPISRPCSRVRAGKGRWGFRSSSSSPMPAPSTSAPDRPRPAVTTYRKAFNRAENGRLMRILGRDNSSGAPVQAGRLAPGTGTPRGTTAFGGSK